MRSIPLAMTWEAFQRVRWGLLGAMLAGCALPAFLLTALRLEGALDPNDESALMLHIIMVLINGTMLGGTLLSAQSDPSRWSRLYALPVPNSVIVTWSLLPAMVAIGIEYVITAMAFNAAFEVGWPLWGPALFLAVSLAAVAASFWLARESPWHLIVLEAATITPLGIWFYSRYGLIFSPRPAEFWREVTPVEIATMVAIAALAYCGAIVGVARGRRGDALATPRFFRWLGKVLDTAPAVGLPFRSKAHAQFWYEWRRKGWAMPAQVLIALPLGLCGWLLFNRIPDDLFQAMVVGGAFLSVGGFIVGLAIGQVGSTDTKFEIGHFLATRPMTSGDMARTILKTAGLSVLLAWVLWAAAFLLLYLILWASHAGARLELPKELGWWYFPATLLGPWLGVSLLATLAMRGRSNVPIIALCGGLALLIVGLLLSKYALPRDVALRLKVAQGSLIAAGGGFVVVAAWALIAARRQAMIGMATVYASVGTWAVLVAMIVLDGVLHHAWPLPVSVFASGLLALVVAPLAAAPLALAWNRNR